MQKYPSALNLKYVYIVFLARPFSVLFPSERSAPSSLFPVSFHIVVVRSQKHFPHYLATSSTVSTSSNYLNFRLFYFFIFSLVREVAKCFFFFFLDTIVKHLLAVYIGRCVCNSNVRSGVIHIGNTYGLFLISIENVLVYHKVFSA